MTKDNMASPQVTDEQIAFDAEWKRSGWGDKSTRDQCFHFWSARSILSKNSATDRIDNNQVFSLQVLCSYLPEEVMWGDSLNPSMLESILRRALSAPPAAETRLIPATLENPAQAYAAAPQEAKQCGYASVGECLPGCVGMCKAESEEAKPVAAVKTEPKPPKWYTRDEIVSILKMMNYSDLIAQELADWMVLHLQYAFNKGFQVRDWDIFKAAAPQEKAPADKDAANEPRIVWSANEEDFREDSLGELLDNHDDLEPGRTVYFGIAVLPTTNQLCDADDIIEMIGERAYDFGGEYAEDFPNVTQDATDELQGFVATWIAKHCVPTFYQVEKIQQRVLTADDFDADDERLQSQPQQVTK